MAVYDLEEQERLDELKDWWERNRTLVLGSLLGFLAVFAAVNGWRHYQQTLNVQAETLHKSFVKLVAEKDAKKITEAATVLVDKYPGTFFANDAALAAARAAFDAKDYATARQQLQWVADKGKAELRPVAQIRLAVVLLEEKKYEEALKVLDGVKQEGFIPLAADVRGDVLAAKGSKEEARAAYQLALDKGEVRSPLRSALQIKMDALGEAK